MSTHPVPTAAPTPLLLLTGFLGAGKTSLLRRVLPAWKAAGLRPQVILNDQANADVDGAALRELVREVHALTGGCLCCDSREALADMLETLDAGADDLVLLETHGATDPLPLVEFLLVGPLRQRFNPVLQVALVDAKRWQRRGHLNALERRQVRTATHVLFTWEDAVTPDRARAVRAAVRELNPHARVLEPADVPEVLLAEARASAALGRPAFVAWIPPRLRALAGPEDEPMLAAFGAESSGTATATGPASKSPPAIRSLPDVSVHRHGKGRDAVHEWVHRFVAVQLEVPRRLPRPRLLRWLEELPAAVIRAKGIVEFEDQPGRFHLFQRVEDTTGFTEIFVLPPGGVTLALLVGLGLEPEALRRQAERRLKE